MSDQVNQTKEQNPMSPICAHGKRAYERCIPCERMDGGGFQSKPVDLTADEKAAYEAAQLRYEQHFQAAQMKAVRNFNKAFLDGLFIERFGPFFGPILRKIFREQP